MELQRMIEPNSTYMKVFEMVLKNYLSYDFRATEKMALDVVAITDIIMNALEKSDFNAKN
jgi:hypothetical protein